MVTIEENGHGNPSSNESVCISHSPNTLGKSMNPTIPAPTMGEIVGQTGLFNLCMTAKLEEGKL